MQGHTNVSVSSSLPSAAIIVALTCQLSSILIELEGRWSESSSFILWVEMLDVAAVGQRLTEVVTTRLCSDGQLMKTLHSV